MENSRNKQVRSFKLCAVLSSNMESRAVPPHPAQDVNHPFDLCIHIVSTPLPPPVPHTSHLVVDWAVRSTATIRQCLCSGKPYFTY